MSYGIVVSKAGYDATSGALDDKNKIFDSSLDHLKTYSSGYFEQTVTSGNSYSGYVAHSLSCSPLCMVYFTTDETNYRVALSGSPDAFPYRYSVGYGNVSVYVDDAKVYFRLTNPTGSSIDFLVKYEIFYEGDA